MILDKDDLPAPPPRPGGTTSLANRTDKGILCAKCNHLNKPGSTKCTRCESHLHIKCNDCGARNERVYSRCQTCGRRLHKSAMEKMHASVFKHGAKVTPFQIALLILVVAAILLIVIGINKVNLPRLRH
jgi:hypothetical protein